MFEWEVNIGDADVIKVKAETLEELEHKIDETGEFDSSMINSVIKTGNTEIYLKSYLPKVIKRIETKYSN